MSCACGSIRALPEGSRSINGVDSLSFLEKTLVLSESTYPSALLPPKTMHARDRPITNAHACRALWILGG